MNRDQKSFDFTMVLFVLGMFALTSFFAMQVKDNAFENLILLVTLFVIIIVGYFFGFVATITTSAVIVFTYGSYVLYNTLVLGNLVGTRVYFWTVLIIYFSIVIGVLHNFITKTEDEIIEMKTSLENYVTVDYLTNMDNMKAFSNSLSQYMHIAKRHKIPLTLMIIKIQHFKEIERITGSSKMLEIVRDVGAAIEGVTRGEDRCFILDERDVFGLVMFTNSEGAQVVKNRLKDNINAVNINLSKKDIKVNIELKVGYAQYENEEIDILRFKLKAEKELEFDV